METAPLRQGQRDHGAGAVEARAASSVGVPVNKVDQRVFVIEGRRHGLAASLAEHEARSRAVDADLFHVGIGEVRGGEALDLLDAMSTGHPGSICTIHADSPRDTLPRLVRLALRNPQAPKAETVLGEIVNTVDLVLYAGFSRSRAAARARRLLSVGTIAGMDEGRPAVQELVGFSEEEGWHRVGSLAAMPHRVRTKLARVTDPDRLLDGFDA